MSNCEVDDADSALSKYEARLSRLDAAGELALLNDLASRWAAGCWLTDAEVEIIAAAPAEVDGFLERMAARSQVRADAQELSFAAMGHVPLEGESPPCWVVVSQQCDLVAPVGVEPFVEVARCYLVGRSRGEALWPNSARQFPLDPREPDWVVDLRHRGVIAKDLLPDLVPRQGLPLDGDQPDFKPRRRFMRRVGQRYSRAAVPTGMVVAITQPLREQWKRHRSILDALAHDIVLHPGDDENKPYLLVVSVSSERTGSAREWATRLKSAGSLTPALKSTLRLDELEPGDDAEIPLSAVAEDFFEAILDALTPSVQDELDMDRCAVIPIDDLSLATWEQCWKIDAFDALSHSRRSADSALPDT